MNKGNFLRKVFVSMVITVLLNTFPAQAQEHWSLFTKTQFPPSCWGGTSYKSSAIFSFFSVVGTGSPPPPLFVSTDGLSFQSINVSESNIHSFVQHSDGGLYAIGDANLVRTFDGKTWNTVLKLPSAGPIDLVSFNGQLYVGMYDGRIWRTTPQASNPIWQLVSPSL